MSKHEHDDDDLQQIADKVLRLVRSGQVHWDDVSPHWRARADQRQARVWNAPPSPPLQ